MRESDRDVGVSPRRVLECMTWAGTGVLWTMTGGVPHSLGIIGEAHIPCGPCIRIRAGAPKMAVACLNISGVSDQ